jgi:hypothetical protein
MHMKLSRLYQPRNPLFWLMVMLNLLSTALAWIGRSYDLAPLAATLVAAMAAGNAALGIYLTFRLIRDEPTASRTQANDR